MLFFQICLSKCIQYSWSAILINSIFKVRKDNRKLKKKILVANVYNKGISFIGDQYFLMDDLG